jgi:hypothetical protein
MWSRVSEGGGRGQAEVVGAVGAAADERVEGQVGGGQVLQPGLQARGVEVLPALRVLALLRRRLRACTRGTGRMCVVSMAPC